MPWEKYNVTMMKTVNGEIKKKHQVGLEKACCNPALPGNVVCADHIRRDPTKKNQSTRDFDHGLIGGPYTVSSRLYGSPAYLELVKQGWRLSPEDEERAKAAQEKARSEPMAPRKSKSTKATEPSLAPAAPVIPPAATIEEAAKKAPRKVRVSKKVLAEVRPAEPESKAAEAPTLLESMSVPIVPYEVVKVKVKKIRLDGKDYFLAPSTGKVYTIGSHGMPEKYKGRYLVTEETAKLDTSYPDSDVEVD